MKIFGLNVTKLIRYFLFRNLTVNRIAQILTKTGLKFSVRTIYGQKSDFNRKMKGVLDFTPTQEQIDSLEKLIHDQTTEPIAIEMEPGDDDDKEIVGEETDLETILHKTFDDLLSFVQSQTNCWLVGPAGSGKTTAARMVAEKLGLQFYFNGAIDSEYKLLGFIDAQGRVISKPFRKAFEEGGVYLFDEVDASLPGAVLAFNAALANGYCDFPDGEVKAHENFRCIAAANTFDGTGEYVGRMKQDNAFLDRFAMLEWGYDEVLEAKIAAKRFGDSEQVKEWIGFVQKCRANAKKHGIKVVISPRATMHGLQLMIKGKMSKAKVIACTIKKGMGEDNFKKVTEGISWVQK